jgi:hypothetical protein
MSRIMPAMSDGRLTNYVSRCQLNGEIQNEFKIKSEAEYRMFLQSQPQAVIDFTKERYNMVMPYWNTTPCVTSLGWPGSNGGVASRLQ